MNKVTNTLKQKVWAPVVNTVSGILLKVSKPFKKGDFIEIDGQLGAVSKKGLQKTTITSLAGEAVTIANHKFYSKDLHNLSTKNIIRLEFNLCISYVDNMPQVKETILNFFSLSQKILNTPTPKLQVKKLKDEYVEICLQPWCLLDHYLELEHELETRLKQHLINQGFHLELEPIEFEGVRITA